MPPRKQRAKASEGSDEIAVTASRLSDHEQVCAERYAQIKDDFKDIFKDLNAIKYAVIALLITMVGYLIAFGVPWKH